MMTLRETDDHYREFLASKSRIAEAVGFDPTEINERLFPFQRDLIRWACRKGRAALWADTGLGKSAMLLEWMRHMRGDDYGLIVTPLAVAEQTIREAHKFGMPEPIFSREPINAPLTITNYQNVHKFTREKYRAIVLDESSILASLDGKTRTLLLKEFTSVPFRLCCTATPAPNDVAELANHSEFLGVLSRVEFLAHFFVHDSDAAGANGWRLKGHAREAFWRWIAHWAAYVRKPSDLGYPDDGFVLPPLNIRDEIVDAEIAPAAGEMFARMGSGITGRSKARRATLSARVMRAAEILRASDEQWLVWCGLNDEQDALAKSLGDECVSIDGSVSDDEKVRLLARWVNGEVRVLISKVEIFGFGLNFQHCHNAMYVGLGDSWQKYYQSIRREWRFGQTHEVNVVIITSRHETVIAENVRRKEAQAAELAAGIIAAVRETQMAEIEGVAVDTSDYPVADERGDGWRLMLGDSCERLREIDSGSVGLSVLSPPFASLYTYSASDRDLGNCTDYDTFFAQFDFIIPEMLRVTMAGRRACVHVQQVTTTKVTHGVIGWRDFRADVVRHFVAAGWIYDGEIVIDKDPQAQAIRTKSKALMFVQKNKDSAWSRPAMADYILLFRAPGDNLIPVQTDVTNEEWILWARPIWYDIRESDTLNAALARDAADERHVAPLQLPTIERCVRLWSNRGELVFDPFAGIGSTGYVSLRHGRKFVGIELKPSYHRRAIANLQSARTQNSLFSS